MTTTTSTMTTVRKIGKREARRRYDAGMPIAMAGEPWWFDHPRECGTITRDSMGGVSFDALHGMARAGTRYSYAMPTDDEVWRASYTVRPEWWDDPAEPRCDVCGIHTEDAAEWCGDTGCCAEHCGC